MNTKLKNWKQFENDIALLFRSAGYWTEQSVEYSGQEFDIIATKPDLGDLNNRIAVECKFRSTGSVGNADVHEFVNAFNASAREHGLTHGILVSNQGFSRQAHEVVHAHPQIRLMTGAVLENELLGARTYLEVARGNYRSDFTNYIALSGETIALRDSPVAVVPDIAALCRRRLLDRKPLFTILLGDFGSGKTTIAEQVHSGLADAFLAEESGVFPLILYLRTLEQHDSEENFIESHLKLSSKNFTLSRLEALRKRNRLALILDGFDEIATNASEDERMRLFSRVMRIAARGHSVMLTSRPSYFNSLEELNTLVESLIERDYAAVDKLSGQLLRRDQEVQVILDRQQAIALKKLSQGAFPTFASTATGIFLIRPLTQADILRFFEPHAVQIKRLYGKTPEQVYQFLTGIYDLTDLLTRPLLLDMFVDLLRANEFQFDQSDKQIGPAGLYHLYINYHLTRDWGVRRFLKPTERLAFARAAAVAMLEAGGSLEASYDSVWNIVRDDKSVLSLERQHLLQSDRDGVVTDVRVCSFMNVTPAGRIEFSHKSFMEYFIAEVIVSRLSQREPLPILARPLNYEILYFLGSYALVRTEIRLEIVQHLQHVAYSQSEIYRSNLLIALMFSEPASTGREFSGIDYSRIRIARKTFELCRLKNVRFRHALLLNTSFTNCEFSDVCVEGEIHDITLNATIGSLLLPIVAQHIRIENCPSLKIGSASGGNLQFEEANWQDAKIILSTNSMFHNSLLRATRLQVDSGQAVHLSATTMQDVTLYNYDFVRESRRLPRLYIEGSKLGNVMLMFMAVTREHYINLVPMLSRCRGVLVVSDSKREIQTFWNKDDDGITRYVGWKKTGKLLLISAEFYDRLDEPTIAAIKATQEHLRLGERWLPHRAAAIVLNSSLSSDARRTRRLTRGSG